MVVVPGGATVVVTRTVTQVALPLVTFEATTTIGGEIVLSSSTVCFREHPEVERDLNEHGFEVVDVHDAPDRLINSRPCQSNNGLRRSHFFSRSGQAQQATDAMATPA